MTAVTVNVTQEDIDHGKKHDCRLCPIALAAKRAFPHLCPAAGSYFLVLDTGPDQFDGELLVMPTEAGRFIQDFDKGRPVQPFSFEVRV